MKITLSMPAQPLKLNGFARKNAYRGIHQMISKRQDLKSTFILKIKKMETLSDDELLQLSTDVAKRVNPHLFN